MCKQNKITYNCPHCCKIYDDGEDKFLKRCKDNFNWSGRVNCSCGKDFKITYTILGKLVSCVIDVKVKSVKRKKKSKDGKPKQN